MRIFKDLASKKAVAWIVLTQISATAVISLVMLITLDGSSAISAFAGGAVGFLTSLVYAKKMFAPEGADLKIIIRSHYSAEAYKLVFTILLSTLAVYWAALIFV